MIEIPFIYTLLQAFSLVLEFDDKKYIKIEDLFKYRDKVLKDVTENYNNDCYKTSEEIEMWGEEIEIKDIDQKEELKNILKHYPKLFYLENDKIHINMDLNAVRKAIEEFEIIHYRFERVNDRKEIFLLLNITKFYEEENNYREIGYKLERQIETAYNCTPLSQSLKKLLYKRFAFILNIVLNNNSFIRKYNVIPKGGKDELVIDANYDYYSNSKYILFGEDYPIDKDLYEESEFYEDIVEALNPIQQNIEDIYQYAIFGRQPLYGEKYRDIFTKLYMKDIFDFSQCSIISEEEFEECDEPDTSIFRINCDIEEEEFAFYIIYIEKLNDLIAEGKTELIVVRNRLLYLLDDIKYCLFLEENFNKMYEKALSYKLEEESFEFFAEEAKYFIKDVFEGNADKTFEKLLFTSTYYQLTKDEEVVDILNEYKTDTRYQEYSQIIFGEIKGYSRKRKK